MQIRGQKMPKAVHQLLLNNARNGQVDLTDDSNKQTDVSMVQQAESTQNTVPSTQQSEHVRAVLAEVARRTETVKEFQIQSEQELELHKKKVRGRGKLDVVETLEILTFMRDEYSEYSKMFKVNGGLPLRGFKTTGKNIDWFKKNVRPILRCYESCCMPTDEKTRLENFKEKCNVQIDPSRQSSRMQLERYGEEKGEKFVIYLSAFVKGCPCPSEDDHSVTPNIVRCKTCFPMASDVTT